MARRLHALTIALTLIVISLAACRANATPTPTQQVTDTPPPNTAVSPTLTLPPSTLTPSRTPLPTPPPTFTPTLRPASTPSLTNTPKPTATSTQPPTFVPATPLVDNARYHLREWTVERAEEMIGRMEAYPDTLPYDQRGYHNAIYNDAFRYAALAEAEAMLRFPNAQKSTNWRWDAAYNLAHSEDRSAIQAYAALITNALYDGLVKPEALPTWFNARETRLTLEVFELDPLPGIISSHLLD